MSAAFTILKRTPVRRKRPGVRRGRIVDTHFLAWMHTHGCLVEGKGSPCVGVITVHHVREYGGQKSDRRTLTLCQGHHQEGAGLDSIEKLGKAAWEAKFGVSIIFEITRYNEAYIAEMLSAPPNRRPDELPYKYEAGQTRRRMIAEELYG